MRNKILFITVFVASILFTSTLAAQNIDTENCEKTQSIHIDDLVISSDIFIQNNLSSINAPERKVKKVLLKNYNFLKSIFFKKDVIKNNVVEKELNAIVNTIIEANPKLQYQKFNMLYALNYEANATSLGNNIFFVYPGLFEILENDEQLTFVLCHEIAHQLLNHFQYSIEEQINLKKITLNKRKTLNIYRNKRELELNADALGFELYSNLNYPKSEAIKALKNLKNSDSILYSKTIDVKAQFHFKNYPFKPFWLNEKEQFLKLKKYTSNYRNLDSLRTHPNIDVRVNALNEKNKTEQETNTKITKNHLNKLKTWQEANYLCLIKNNYRYDLLLFFALEKHYKNPKNIFAAEVIANTLLKIYKAKKEKQFSKYIPPPNAFAANTSFSKLKMFLKNTEAREIRKIGLSFCNSLTTKSDTLIKIQKKFKHLNR